MPPVLRAFDLVDNIRESAERLRQRELEQSVLGLVRANMIEANAITLGIDGNVGVSVGALTAGDPSSLLGFPPGTLTLGGSVSLIDIPSGALAYGNPSSLLTVNAGALVIGNEVSVPTSAITNVMLAPDSVTAPKIQANAVGTNELAANAVTAGKINVAQLDAITADMGTLTSGSIKLPSASADPRLEITPSGIKLVATGADGSLDVYPSTLTWRQTSDDASIGAIRGNNPAISGTHAHQMDVAASYGGNAGFGFVTSQISTWTFSTGTELGFVRVDANGTVDGTSAWNNVSDRKVKDKIVHLDRGLEAVRALKPRSFTRKQSGRREHGFVAQEVEPIIPEAVRDSYIRRYETPGDPESAEIREPLKTLTESHILAHVVKGLQELSDEVDKLKAKK